ncbi:hypothetical protein PFLL34_00667 [Pseudomonas fluorescens]|nr:hypothetical protein PFLL34_00667 [Pseudomonas fluorescens]
MSISGKVRRPKMWRSRSSIKAATSTSAQSLMPSTLSFMNASERSPKASAVRTRSSSTNC